MVFSFYYTDKIALLVQSKNPIMIEIENIKKDNYEKSVNAIIEDDYIIPGKNGLTINSSKSFSLMKSFGAFNSYYLVYDQIIPKISLEDNKDKIIKTGNYIDQKMSIVIEYNQNTIKYFDDNNIKADILVDVDTYDVQTKLEKINNDFSNYNKVNSYLKSASNNICFLENKNNLQFCRSKKKYLVEPTIVLNNNNVFEVKNSIKNGIIILIKNSTNIDNVNVILNQIKFKGLTPIYLTDLISEENN